jgi:hypothetical protein
MGGLKTLFQEHYIDVPENKTDLIQELTVQVESLKNQINEITEQNIELKQSQKEHDKKKIIEECCVDLSLSQQEKLKTLVEDMEFTNSDQFTKKINILKKSYFGGKAKQSENLVETLGENVDTSIDKKNTNSKMDLYVKALESNIVNKTSGFFGGGFIEK